MPRYVVGLFFEVEHEGDKWDAAEYALSQFARSLPEGVGIADREMTSEVLAACDEERDDELTSNVCASCDCPLYVTEEVYCVACAAAQARERHEEEEDN